MFQTNSTIQKTEKIIHKRIKLTMNVSAFTHRIPLIYENGVCIMSRKNETKKTEKIDAKRESKNRDACQQAFLISLLVVNGYEIRINKLYKTGNITIQMFTISTIIKNGQEVFNENQIHSKDIKERRQYIDAMTNDSLIALLRKEGYEIEERKTRKTVNPDSISMKRIGSIFSETKFFSFNKLVDNGRKVHDIIRDKVSTKNGLTIQPYDPLLSSIFC